MRDTTREFERLVGPHFETLYRAAYRLTRRRQDAEDLVQDVCLRAYSALGTLGTLDSVPAWLLRVQYRLFVDRERRRRRAPLDAAADVTVFAEHPSAAPGPDDCADASLRQQHLEAAWTALGAEQRALLAMHVEGYTLTELADMLGKNRNLLSARLHRARRRLAKLMRASLGHEPFALTE